MSSWREDAACQEHAPDFWFPNNHRSEDAKFARSVCQGQCPVKHDCLIYALTSDTRYGIWGGEDMAHYGDRLRSSQVVRRG